MTANTETYDSELDNIRQDEIDIEEHSGSGVVDHNEYKDNAFNKSTYEFYKTIECINFDGDYRIFFIYIDPAFCSTIQSGIGIACVALQCNKRPVIMYLQHRFMETNELVRVNSIIKELVLSCIAAVVKHHNHKPNLSFFVFIENNSSISSVGIVYNSLRSMEFFSFVDVFLYYSEPSCNSAQKIPVPGYSMTKDKKNIVAKVLKLFNEHRVGIDCNIPTVNPGNHHPINYLMTQCRTYRYCPDTKTYTGKIRRKTSDDLITATILSIYMAVMYGPRVNDFKRGDKLLPWKKITTTNYYEGNYVPIEFMNKYIDTYFKPLIQYNPSQLKEATAIQVNDTSRGVWVHYLENNKYVVTHVLSDRTLDRFVFIYTTDLSERDAIALNSQLTKLYNNVIDIRKDGIMMDRRIDTGGDSGTLSALLVWLLAKEEEEEETPILKYVSTVPSSLKEDFLTILNNGTNINRTKWWPNALKYVMIEASDEETMNSLNPTHVQRSKAAIIKYKMELDELYNDAQKKLIATQGIIKQQKFMESFLNTQQLRSAVDKSKKMAKDIELQHLQRQFSAVQYGTSTNLVSRMIHSASEFLHFTVYKQFQSALRDEFTSNNVRHVIDYNETTKTSPLMLQNKMPLRRKPMFHNPTALTDTIVDPINYYRDAIKLKRDVERETLVRKWVSKKSSEFVKRMNKIYFKGSKPKIPQRDTTKLVDVKLMSSGERKYDIHEGLINLNLLHMNDIYMKCFAHLVKHQTAANQHIYVNDMTNKLNSLASYVNAISNGLYSPLSILIKCLKRQDLGIKNVIPNAVDYIMNKIKFTTFDIDKMLDIDFKHIFGNDILFKIFNPDEYINYEEPFNALVITDMAQDLLPIVLCELMLLKLLLTINTIQFVKKSHGSLVQHLTKTFDDQGQGCFNVLQSYPGLFTLLCYWAKK